MSDKNLNEVIDETLEVLSDLTEDEIRQRLSERKIPIGVDFRRTIGGTEYTVVSHFNQNARDDIFHKVKRLLESDIAA